MRLADQIIECAETGAPDLREDYRLFAAEIRRAAIYEIDPAACELAAAISGRKRSDAFQTTYPVSRTPFRRCWFEWIGECERYIEGTTPQAVIFREGVLTVTDETHQVGTAWHARSFRPEPSGAVMLLSPYCLEFDWRPLSELQADAVETDPWRARRARVGTTDAECRELRMRYRVQPSLFRAEHARRIVEAAASPSEARAVYQTELEGNHNTTLFLRGLLVCLNSRNLLTASAPESIDKINRARARSGKPARVSFSRVKVNLSAVMRRKTEAASGAPGGMRAHLVAGHFKVRKSGVFWWSPFVRGDEQQGKVIREGYQVVRAARGTQQPTTSAGG